MTRRTRSVLTLVALGVLGATLVAAVTGLEPFGHFPGRTATCWPVSYRASATPASSYRDGPRLPRLRHAGRGDDPLRRGVRMRGAAARPASRARGGARDAGAAGTELRGAGHGRGAGRSGHGPRRLRDRPRAPHSRRRLLGRRRRRRRAAAGLRRRAGSATAAGELDRPPRRGRSARRRRLPGARARGSGRDRDAAEELPGAGDVGDAALGGHHPRRQRGHRPRGRRRGGLVFAEFLEQALLDEPE